MRHSIEWTSMTNPPQIEKKKKTTAPETTLERTKCQV